MSDAKEEIGEIGSNVTDSINERIKEVLQKLETRANSVMTRLTDEDLDKIDALIEVDLFDSRSEAVAYFTHQGIEARRDLFREVMDTVERIRELKEMVKLKVQGEPKEEKEVD